jgi:uncharacterized protein (TIGR04222 family)
MDVPATLNPLDWTAGPFLVLYAALALTAVAVVVVARYSIGPEPAAPAADDLGLLELAWLHGGPARAADTVLLCFLAANAAEVDPTRREIRFSPLPAYARDAWPDIFGPFASHAAGIASRAQFHRSVGTEFDAVRQRLVQRGLAASPAELVRFTTLVWGLVAMPLLLGISKIIVGSSRGKPVGILTVLVLATLVFAMVSTFNPPRSTRAGRTAIRRSARRNARAIRAPLAEELALAFAMSGATVLAGTPYQTFARLLPKPEGGGGCSGGGGGGSGGGGCGGCGGGH